MIVVDTSVAIKWVVREEGHEQALAIFDMGQDIAAPDLLVPEMANVLRKKLRRGEVTLDQAHQALATVANAIPRLIPSVDLSRDALALAHDLDHSAYDCFFLAAALGGGLLISADRIFVDKCRQKGFADQVTALEDVGGTGSSPP